MAETPLISVRGADTASRHLTALAKRGEDARPAFRSIQRQLRKAEAEWFRRGGRGTWPELDEDTRRIKRREGLAPEPLVATGALLRSLTVERGRGARRSAGKTKMTFGTSVYYGRFHERGEAVPKRRILVPLDTRTRRRMVSDVRDHMLGKGKSW